jgi:polyketide cyclase/dehydrase/lipid transport protein
MEVDRSAPVVAESKLEIGAEPGVVWDTIADFERWPAWNPDVNSVSLDGPVAEGMTFRWKAGPATITSTLRCVERPGQIGWTGKTLGIAAVHVWRFDADDGHTVASTAESWAGWLPRLLRGRMRKQLQDGLDAGLPHLKIEAERRAAAR